MSCRKRHRPPDQSCVIRGPDIDRADLSVSAQVAEERERSRRTAAGVALGAVAMIAPFIAAPVTGSGGAVVGAVVLSLLLSALAVAVWPYEWSAAERRHRELDAIWRELRSDADALVPWERYAAWAEPAGTEVKLSLITCGAQAGEAPPAPSPYSLQVVRRLAAEDMEAATEAMEELRAEASQRELEARRGHEQGQADAERAAHEMTLQEIEERAAADVAAGEEQLRREQAAQEEAEQKAQAEVLARALRRQ